MVNRAKVGDREVGSAGVESIAVVLGRLVGVDAAHAVLWWERQFGPSPDDDDADSSADGLFPAADADTGPGVCAARSGAVGSLCPNTCAPTPAHGPRCRRRATTVDRRGTTEKNSCIRVHLWGATRRNTP
jgi:hypothetical protein